MERHFLEKGAEGLKLKHKGSTGYLSLDERKEIINYISSLETLTLDDLRNYIKNQYGVEYSSQKSYTDLMHAANFGYKKTQKNNPKSDPEQVENKKRNPVTCNKESR